MTPLEATVQLMTNWAVTGLLKNRTPEELRGDAISLCTGLTGATNTKPTRKPKKQEVTPEVEYDPFNL